MKYWILIVLLVLAPNVSFAAVECDISTTPKCPYNTTQFEYSGCQDGSNQVSFFYSTGGSLLYTLNCAAPYIFDVGAGYSYTMLESSPGSSCDGLTLQECIANFNEGQLINTVHFKISGYPVTPFIGQSSTTALLASVSTAIGDTSVGLYAIFALAIALPLMSWYLLPEPSPCLINHPPFLP